MKFELIQRLDEAKDGFPANPLGDDMRLSKMLMDRGAEFDLSYMGSWRYHENAHPSANRVASNAPNLRVIARQLKLPAHSAETIHIVCADDQQETLDAWQEWAENYDGGAIEPTGFFPHYDFDQFDLLEERTVGWWALKEDILWAREEEVAINILETFQTAYAIAVEAQQEREAAQNQAPNV